MIERRTDHWRGLVLRELLRSALDHARLQAIEPDAEVGALDVALRIEASDVRPRSFGECFVAGARAQGARRVDANLWVESVVSPSAEKERVTLLLGDAQSREDEPFVASGRGCERTHPGADRDLVVGVER